MNVPLRLVGRKRGAVTSYRNQIEPLRARAGAKARAHGD